MFSSTPPASPPEALTKFLAFLERATPRHVLKMGGDNKVYIVSCDDCRNTAEILDYWRQMGLQDSGHKLVLRGKSRLYGVSPLPHNRGIEFINTKPMLTALPEQITSIQEVIQALNPSSQLKFQLQSLYNTKGVFIYKNRPDEGYPCFLALGPITPTRLNKPIEEYIGQPIRAIDSDISAQRQTEIERLLEEKQDNIHYRRQFTSSFTWNHRKWTLINETWYLPEDDAIIVTAADPHDYNGLRQQEYFLDMIRDGFADPNPEIDWETIF